MAKPSDHTSISPIHAIYHPQLRIDNSIELTARYFQGAAKFVDFIITQNNKCKFAAICPFQFDFCIAVGKPLETLNSNYNDDSDDEDDLCYMDSIDQQPKYMDCIGDIEAKLKANNLRYASRNLEPSLGGYEMSRRDFVDLLKLLKEKYASSNPFDVDGNYVYPHKKRFIVMVDRRDVNGDEYETIYIWEAPEKCRDIPNQDAAKWCVNATNDCILPGYDRDDNIGASSRCHGSLLTLSFHVLQEDEIKCHLGWNGKLCSAEPSDLKEVLPKIFNMEHTWRGVENKQFINKKKREIDTMHGNYIFENNFTLENMADDINNIIYCRDKKISVNTDTDHALISYHQELNEYIVHDIQYIVQDILCGANPSQPDLDYLHRSFANESIDDLPDLPQQINNYAVTCPQEGSNQSNAVPNNNQNSSDNSEQRQSHRSRNNYKSNGNGYNQENGGDGDDEKDNNINNNSILVPCPPCAGCQALLSALREKDAILAQKDSIIAQKNSLILQYQQLVNKLQQQTLIPYPYPFSMPTTPPQYYNNSYVNHNINNRTKYKGNVFSYPAHIALKETKSNESHAKYNKNEASTPTSFSLTDIQSRTASIPSVPNSPLPDYPLRSVSNTSTATLTSLSTDSCSSISKEYSPKAKCKKNKKPDQSIYEPSDAFSTMRLKRNVYIDQKFTQKILSTTNIPCNDKKQLYSWMDMNTIPQFERKENELNDAAKILNFNFVDKETEKPLYCVIAVPKEEDDEKHTAKARKQRWRWEMRQKLYTKQMIIDEFNMKIFPKAVNISGDQRISEYLSDSKNWNNVINKTKWHKLKVFSNLDNKRRNILSISPEAFKLDMRAMKHQQGLDIFPILLFINDQYEIHHLIIVQIHKSQIAISFIYDEKQNKAQVKAIHMNKSLLYKQHRWISSLQHINKCKCFDNFGSNTDHIEIGNVNDKINTIQNLENIANELKKENKRLKHQLRLSPDRSTSPSVSGSSQYSCN